MNRKLLRGRFLLIYQMPKTGSQTVEATLQQCRLPHRVIRFHFLSTHTASAMKKALLSNQATEEWKGLARAQLEGIKEIRRIIWWRKRLTLLGPIVPKLEIITGLREVIGLGLSSVFENHGFLFPNLASASVETCRSELLRPNVLNNIQNWFDLEIKPVLDIDVYATPFPQTKRNAVYENRFARLLLYRSDGLQLLPNMLAEFLDCEVPSVVNRNIGSSKDYGVAYESVKSRFRMPADYVRAQYNSKMMRHFYSDAERRAFIDRWAEEVPSTKAPLAA
jgi:hypothetical protein